MKKILKLIGFLLITLCFFAQTAFAAGKVYFYHTDPAGTPLAMTDANGNIVWRADYKPFGEEHSVSGSIQNRKEFIGKEKDAETGLDYFGARYHKDKIGRFLSPDPVGPVDPRTGKVNQKILHNPQMLNPYAYALNNPYKYVDPDGAEVRISGHTALSPWGAITKPPSYHLSIILIPDKPGNFKDRRGWETDSNGKISAALGGHTNFGSGKLISTPNYETDKLKYSEFSQTVETPNGMSDTQFINNLIRASDSYKNDLTYEMFPSSEYPGYNSNSYVSGILKAAGATPPELNTGGKFKVPGYDRPIPLK